MARRPFADTLRDLRGGVALDELADKLAELTLAVAETSKPGKLTLTLEVKPVTTLGDAVAVTDKITVSAPEHARAGTIFFTTPEGNLQRNHPKQDDLPGLEVVGGKSAAASH